jgi:nucleoside-triphosphatase THEP1
MNYRREDLYRPVQGSCRWILAHDNYKQWMKQGHGLLWIKGKPGSGKSTLLGFVFQNLKGAEAMENKERNVLDFFFSSRGNQLQKSPGGMFRTLLFRLLKLDDLDPLAKEPIRKEFKERRLLGRVGKDWNWRTQELKHFFNDALLTAAKAKTIIIIVDALDEAGEEARGLVEYFHSLNNQLESANATAKICISCRHFPVQSIRTGLTISVEEQNREDIERYVHDRLQMNEKKSHEWQRLGESIVERSSGIFQWVNLVVSSVLQRDEEGETMEGLRQRVMDVPSELGNLYKDLLESVKDSKWDRTLHLMQWICLSKRLLSVEELYLAVASDNANHDLQPPCGDQVDSMKKIILSSCSGLVEVKTHDWEPTTVQLIHQSVKDFLLEDGFYS